MLPAPRRGRGVRGILQVLAQRFQSGDLQLGIAQAQINLTSIPGADAFHISTMIRRHSNQRWGAGRKDAKGPLTLYVPRPHKD